MDTRDRRRRCARPGELRFDTERNAGTIRRRVRDKRTALILALLFVAAPALAEGGHNRDFDFGFGEWTASTFRLEQALSTDDGANRESNGIARFERATGADGAAQEAAATKLWAAIDEAWNARDAARFAKVFSEDAMMVFFDPDETLAGRDAIREAFTQRFPKIAARFEHRSVVTRVRTIDHDMLAVDGTVDVVRRTDDPDAAPEPFKSFRVFSLLARSEDGWRLRDMRVYPSGQ